MSFSLICRSHHFGRTGFHFANLVSIPGNGYSIEKYYQQRIDQMPPLNELSPEALCTTCDPDSLGFSTTDGLADLDPALI
jgi:hypothetical protein